MDRVPDGRRRRMAIGAVLALALVACAGEDGEVAGTQQAEPSSTSPATVAQTAPPTTRAPAMTTTTLPPTTTTVATPAPIKLQGTGKKATEPFPIAGGMAVFHLTHSGGSNFIVRLATTSGESVGASLVTSWASTTA